MRYAHNFTLNEVLLDSETPYAFLVNLRMPFVCIAGKIVVSTSCSLLHTAVDLVNETKLDNEIKSWLAFAAQKVDEVVTLSKALIGQPDRVKFLTFLELP